MLAGFMSMLIFFFFLSPGKLTERHPRALEGSNGDWTDAVQVVSLGVVARRWLEGLLVVGRLQRPVGPPAPNFFDAPNINQHLIIIVLAGIWYYTED